MGLLIAACCMLLSCDSARPDTAIETPDVEIDGDELLWPAPAVNRTLRLKPADEQQWLYLKSDVDYEIVLPPTPVTHRLTLVGGRNIRIIGGAFKLKGYEDLSTNTAALAFWYSDDGNTQERLVHVEGLEFDMTDARDRDAIAFNDENATFQIQNVRFFNVNGDHEGLHPDAIENWGGAKEVRIFRSTVITDHQGFLLSPLQPTQTHPIEFVDIRQVDFRRNDGTYGNYPNHKCPIFLWLVYYRQKTCQTYERGGVISEVYATHPENCWDFGMNTTMPNTIQPERCLSHVSEDGTQISWPTLPLTGTVNQGPPPGGEFVPDGVAGIGYKSPGYLSAP
ncbi:MAG: hypothetical protein KJO98_12000 [Rhodothermia bacterium]|nr:hypothetical protein [Rhodothermia bacterium]